MTMPMMENPHINFTVGKSGVRVFFPFEPYDTQKEYVAKVIEALTGGHNAILESPTGTGKSLSLLCSTLAWLNDERGGIKKSMIYYTSRTHMQLNQAANELKRTAYAKNPAVVIGSRSKMCLNKDVTAEQGDHLINRACRNAIARNACEYFANYEQKLEVMNQDAVNDIEDLLKFGTTHKCCPYYASKKIAESKASVVFMPYNYMLDTSMKKSIQLRLENSVIIFDEGHNLEGALKDSASGEFTLTCLDVVRESCLKLPSKLSEAMNNEKHGLSRNGYDPQRKRDTIRDEFSNKKNGKQEKEVKVNPIDELVEKLTNDKLQQVNKCAEELKQQISSNLKLDESCSIDKVYSIMRASGVQYTTSDTISTTLESMASFWSIAGVMNPAYVTRYVSAITNLSQVISLLFPGDCISVKRQQENEQKLGSFYGAYLKGIYEESAILKQGKYLDSELCLWCLHPGIGLKRVIDSNCMTGPRSIIITSGTLAPLHSLPREMDMEFKISQEFKHVINDNQLKILIIGNSPKGYSLNSSYSNIYERGPSKTILREKYAIELGETLIPMLKVLPFGTLIFFPSYGLLNKVKKVWDKSNVSQRMNNVCQMYVEDTQQDKFLAKVADYKKNIDGKTAGTPRAAFLGVCRGKLSEGTNLAGNHCRAVIMIGLPYPSLQDPKIVLTEKFHETRGRNEKVSMPGQGKVWYSQQMNRTLNQTIGRVIRSRSDYGMVIFCDPRFRQTKYSLSKWAADFCPRVETPWNKIDQEIKGFYQLHGVAITESASESCGAFEIGFSSKMTRSNILDDWSSSTESVDQQTISQQRSNNGCQPSDMTASAPRSVAEKQTALISGYRVDKDTYNKARDRVRPTTEPAPVKKQKTTIEVFNSIFESIHPTTSTQRINKAASQSQKSIIQPFASRSKNKSSSASQNNSLTSQQSNNASSQSVQLQSRGPTLTNNVQTFNVPSQESSHASQKTNKTNEYSIIERQLDKNRPGYYKCDICKNLAIDPFRTNCICARVGCYHCLKVLKNRPCGKCKTLLEEKKFKQLLFLSASGKEKYPVITIKDRLVD